MSRLYAVISHKDMTHTTLKINYDIIDLKITGKPVKRVKPAKNSMWIISPNKSSWHFIHEIKRKGYDYIGVNVFPTRQWDSLAKGGVKRLWYTNCFIIDTRRQKSKYVTHINNVISESGLNPEIILYYQWMECDSPDEHSPESDRRFDNWVVR